MTRVEFSYNLCQLIIEMFKEGEQPLIDFVKRSAEEQKRLYDLKLSKCDGRIIVSQHQLGRAADIYFVKDGKLVEPKFGHEYWHRRWADTYKGAEMIEWDAGHYEG